MSLEGLLARLEAGTAGTSEQKADVPAQMASQLAWTAGTAGTAETIKGEAENIPVALAGPNGCTVTPLAGLPKAGAPVLLDEALRAACDGVGITPEVFRSLLSREDITDIEGGDIHPKTLGAYAMSFAEGLRSGRIVVPGREP